MLHASLTAHLLRLSHDRYSVLSQWPDFTSMYGKDVYYRSHPDDVRKFYAQVDEFHRAWDVVTEFDALGHLATQLVPVCVCCCFVCCLCLLCVVCLFCLCV